jgi:NADH-quinone oxidoreductase subunit H
VSLAWHLVALNWGLLTTAAFLGGWQGPLAEQFAWLGYLYTATKVAALAVLRAWASAYLPIAHPLRRARTAWAIYLPALLVNLALTAALTVLR